MYKPFAILDEWVGQGRIRLSAPVEAVADATPLEVDDSEERDQSIADLPDLPDHELFEFAMRDVRSLGWSAVPLADRLPLELQAHDREQEALRELEEFVRSGHVGIEHTEEYVERSVQPHGRLYLNDLRRGQFSIQAHLDLHGFSAPDARFVTEEFILESVRAGFSCVRVVHGRGRHSHKNRSILKENIQRWLSSRRMRRHVVAYTSARVCDGGGGALYVLLRR